MSDKKNKKGITYAIRYSQKDAGKEPFTVLLGDSITKRPVPCTKQLIDIYSKYKSSAISLEEVPPEMWSDTESSAKANLSMTSIKSQNSSKSHQEIRHHQTLQ